MFDYELSRNGSKYYDPTAYKALQHYIKSEEDKMEVYAGDIFRAEMANGLEREFVILAVHGDFSTVLMLSDNEAQPYAIKCAGMKYTNPGMLSYQFNNRFTTLIRTLTKEEHESLMNSVIEALGVSVSADEKALVPVESRPLVDMDSDMKDMLTKAQTERDIYKSLYENLIGSMMR